MLQNKFEMPLDLAVKNSKIFYTYLVVIFLCALISILLLNSLPFILRLLLFVMLLVMASLTLKIQKTKRVTSLRINGSDEWELEVNNKQHFEVELYGECIVTYFLIWLNFTTSNIDGKMKKFHILLLPDSADKDLLRQLRVRLRFLSNTNEKNSVIASDSAAIS